MVPKYRQGDFIYVKSVMDPNCYRDTAESFCQVIASDADGSSYLVCPWRKYYGEHPVCVWADNDDIDHEKTAGRDQKWRPTGVAKYAKEKKKESMYSVGDTVSVVVENRPDLSRWATVLGVHKNGYFYRVFLPNIDTLNFTPWICEDDIDHEKTAERKSKEASE